MLHEACHPSALPPVYRLFCRRSCANASGHAAAAAGRGSQCHANANVPMPVMPCHTCMQKLTQNVECLFCSFSLEEKDGKING